MRAAQDVNPTDAGLSIAKRREREHISPCGFQRRLDGDAPDGVLAGGGGKGNPGCDMSIYPQLHKARRLVAIGVGDSNVSGLRRRGNALEGHRPLIGQGGALASRAAFTGA